MYANYRAKNLTAPIINRIINSFLENFNIYVFARIFLAKFIKVVYQFLRCLLSVFVMLHLPSNFFIL